MSDAIEIFKDKCDGLKVIRLEDENHKLIGAADRLLSDSKKLEKENAELKQRLEIEDARLCELITVYNKNISIWEDLREYLQVKVDSCFEAESEIEEEILKKMEELSKGKT